MKMVGVVAITNRLVLISLNFRGFSMFNWNSMSNWCTQGFLLMIAFLSPQDMTVINNYIQINACFYDKIDYLL